MHVNRDHDCVAPDTAGDLQEEARLAHTGRTLDHDDAHLFLDGLGEAREHLPVLGTPADEREHFHRPRRERRHEPARGRQQARVLVEHAPLELHDLGRRFDTQLVAQRDAQRLRRAQGVGLPARAVERGNLLRPQVLAQRFALDERVDPDQHFEVPARAEHCIVARLDQVEPQLANPTGALDCERQVAEIFKGIAGPEGQRHVEVRDRPQRIVGGECGSTLLQQDQRDSEVGLVLRDGQAVAAGKGLHSLAVLAEPAAQPRHNDLQGGIRGLGLRLAPQRAGECRIAHRAVRVQHQQRQERARPAGGDGRDDPLVVDHSNLAQYAELHGAKATEWSDDCPGKALLSNHFHANGPGVTR